MATTKYVIPVGGDFTVPGAGEFFLWLGANNVDVTTISPAHRVIVTHASGWTLNGTWLDGTVTGPIAMSIPDPITQRFLSDQFGPKAGAMDDQRDLIERFRKARKAESEAKAEAEELRAEILRLAEERGVSVITVDGKPVLQKNVLYDKSKTDYATMKRVYPDMFEQYTSYYDETRLEFIK